MSMFRARKRFGQHFLQDASIISRIISAVNPHLEDSLVEIGPGQGALTFPLLSLYSELKFILIEIDRDIVKSLTLNIPRDIYKNTQIYQTDALKFDFSSLAFLSPLRIIGNLPYNISTPLLFRLLSYKNMIKDMHFMLQKEVVDRMSALPHTKNYGRLSIMLQYDFDIMPLFSVPREAFSPIPSVESAIVRLIPKKSSLLVKDKILFKQLVQEAFQHRRKTLKNALKNYLTEENMIKYNINPGLRPEALSVEEYVTLSNDITETKTYHKER